MARGYTHARETGTRTGERPVLIVSLSCVVHIETLACPSHPALLGDFDHPSQQPGGPSAHTGGGLC
ncbi:hypothetical protein A5625_18505 [Mycobacterium sp. 1465703.0]|nr:hypothetical protein A5625_18505 [Mycobacterium sp. 1465703.0]